MITPPTMADASLVLTVLNEAPALPAFLRSIERQTVRPREVVVVDGGSADETTAVLRTWRPPQGVTMRVMIAPRSGIAAGRNVGIAASLHETVAVTDGGTELDPRWLEELMTALASASKPDVAAGFFRPSGNAFVERLIACTITPRLSEIAGSKFLPSSRSIAFHKRCWRSIGGYPEWIDCCEDLIFDLDLLSAGATFKFVPGATVTWRGRPSLWAFARQYYRYARGDGKAQLWPKRHAVRYGAYALAAFVVLPRRRDKRAVAGIALGFVAYLWKFLNRVFAARHDLGRRTLPALCLVPVVVLIGDASKMAGYPAGALWRRRHARNLPRPATPA